MQRKALPFLALAEPLESRRLLAGIAYYVSATGNDTNAGTSPSAPWKSIARANAHQFSAGDSLLFQGGSVFSGNLFLGSTDAGTSSSPITISSYGTGSASISAGKTDGITIRDAGGISISNLTITGSGPTTNTGTGIDLIDDQTKQPRIGYITINDVAVSGFGFVGVGIGSTSLSTGFTNVSITNSTVSDNAESGIFSYAGKYTANPAPYGLAHANIFINNVTADNNPGRPGNNDSGNGIELGNVNGAVIEHCSAYSNGADNNSTIGGPVGIWTYNSNDVVIQYNQSYSNTAAHIDGDGFDLDGGTTNSIVQYNYSHNNAGAGILETQFTNAAPSTGNIIRYNICQNDARKQTQGGIYLTANSASDTIKGTQVYNNTVYVTKPSVGSAAALVINQSTSGLTIRNNIFDVDTTMKTVVVKSAGSGLVFQNNNYWTGSSTVIAVQWGSTIYQTLGAFRSGTGQEKQGSNPTGTAVNPLISHGATIYAPAPTSASDFVLLPNTPLAAAGANFAVLGINPGKNDYFGNTLPSSGNLTVGAYQLTGQLTASAKSLALIGSVYLPPQVDASKLDIPKKSPAPAATVPTTPAPAAPPISLTQATGWSDGDFNYDSSIDPLIDKTELTQVSNLKPMLRPPVRV